MNKPLLICAALLCTSMFANAKNAAMERQVFAARSNHPVAFIEATTVEASTTTPKTAQVTIARKNAAPCTITLDVKLQPTTGNLIGHGKTITCPEWRGQSQEVNGILSDNDEYGIHADTASHNTLTNLYESGSVPSGKTGNFVFLDPVTKPLPNKK